MSYISLEEDIIKKESCDAHKRAEEEYGDDAAKSLLWDDLDDNVSIDEIDGQKLTISVRNRLGFFSFELDLDDDSLFELIDYLRKKGEKIKRLINLVEEKQ